MYEPKSSSTFASAARQSRHIKFTSKVDCQIGAFHIEVGDELTATKLDNGLWAVSGQWEGWDQFAYLNPNDINKLAGSQIVTV